MNPALLFVLILFAAVLYSIEVEPEQIVVWTGGLSLVLGVMK